MTLIGNLDKALADLKKEGEQSLERLIDGLNALRQQAKLSAGEEDTKA